MGKDIISHSENYQKIFCERKNYNCLCLTVLYSVHLPAYLDCEIYRTELLYEVSKKKQKKELAISMRTNIYITITNNYIQILDIYDSTKASLCVWLFFWHFIFKLSRQFAYCLDMSIAQCLANTDSSCS